MKRIALIVLAITTLGLACKTKYTYPRFDYVKSNGVNPCITAFKDRVFFAIIQECYKGTNAMQEIRKRDAGNPYDGVYSPALFKKIDSIGKDFAKRIPPPSLCDECTKEQNYFMAQALHFYGSYELDSIAKAELKNFSSDCLK